MTIFPQFLLIFYHKPTAAWLINEDNANPVYTPCVPGIPS